MDTILIITSIFAGVLIGISATMLVSRIRNDVSRNEEAVKSVLVDFLATQLPELNRLFSTPPDEVFVHLKSDTAFDLPRGTRTAIIRVRTGTNEDSVTLDVTSRPELWQILRKAASPSRETPSRIA